jgi:rhamnosyltransferase
MIRKLKVDNSVAAPVEADYIISSGSLIRTRVFEIAGMMREELFIDWVDIEWGLRARELGFKCFVIPGAMMKHSVGDASVQVFRKNINLHNDIRNYYIVRNATYLLGIRTMGWQWRLITLLRIPRYILFYSLYSSGILRALRLLLRAVRDGLRGEVGPFK